MTTSNAKTIVKLENKVDWMQLLEGRADVICLKEFASPCECKELLTFVISHPNIGNYTNAAGIVRLGSSFNDIRKSRRIEEEYQKPDILQEIVTVNSVVLRIFGMIAATWPFGLEAFSYNGMPLHRVIARRIKGGGAEPHDDDVAKELADDVYATGVKIQLGLNLYIEVPSKGGELEGWHRRLTKSQYDQLRNPDSKLRYGIRRDVLGSSDWIIKPLLGDLIIFQNSEIHAIYKSDETRATVGFFLGYRGDDKPLLVWS